MGASQAPGLVREPVRGQMALRRGAARLAALLPLAIRVPRRRPSGDADETDPGPSEKAGCARWRRRPLSTSSEVAAAAGCVAGHSLTLGVEPGAGHRAPGWSACA